MGNSDAAVAEDGALRGSGGNESAPAAAPAGVSAERARAADVAGERQVDDPAESAAAAAAAAGGLGGGGAGEGSMTFPEAVIKRLMRKDDEVKLVSADAVRLVARSTALFLESLTAAAYSEACKRRRSTIQEADVIHAVTMRSVFRACVGTSLSCMQRGFQEAANADGNGTAESPGTGAAAVAASAEGSGAQGQQSGITCGVRSKCGGEGSGGVGGSGSSSGGKRKRAVEPKSKFITAYFLKS